MSCENRWWGAHPQDRRLVWACVHTRVTSRPPRPSTFTLVLGSIYHGCSGSVRFTCFDQVTIPRLWIGEHIFREHRIQYIARISNWIWFFNVSAHGEHFPDRKSPWRRIPTGCNPFVTVLFSWRLSLLSQEPSVLRFPGVRCVYSVSRNTSNRSGFFFFQVFTSLTVSFISLFF